MDKLLHLESKAVFLGLLSSQETHPSKKEASEPLFSVFEGQESSNVNNVLAERVQVNLPQESSQTSEVALVTIFGEEPDPSEAVEFESEEEAASLPEDEEPLVVSLSDFMSWKEHPELDWFGSRVNRAPVVISASLLASFALYGERVAVFQRIA